MVAHWPGKPKVGGSSSVVGGWIFQRKNQSWKGWEMLMRERLAEKCDQRRGQKSWKSSYVISQCERKILIFHHILNKEWKRKMCQKCKLAKGQILYRLKEIPFMG